MAPPTQRFGPAVTLLLAGWTLSGPVASCAGPVATVNTSAPQGINTDAGSWAAAAGPKVSDQVGGGDVTPARPSAPHRLAWVNPARCLSSCAHDPTANLVRVDGLATPTAVGRHLVDGAAHVPLKQLLSAGIAAGHELAIRSAFRSYEEQAEVFRTTRQVGRAARPGHSEHQLGTAVDVQLPTKAAISWLAANAPQHGFVISYPDSKQRVTGYRPEPWHIRFVGVAIAAEVARTPGLSLEEFLRGHPELGESGTCEDCPAAVSRAPACDSSREARPDTDLASRDRREEAGRCRRSVLTWCYDGIVTAVDCAAFGQICGKREDHYDCLPPTPLPAGRGPRPRPGPRPSPSR